MDLNPKGCNNTENKLNGNNTNSNVNYTDDFDYILQFSIDCDNDKDFDSSHIVPAVEVQTNKPIASTSHYVNEKKFPLIPKTSNASSTFSNQQSNSSSNLNDDILNIDKIIEEKKDLLEKLYIAKGQHKLTEDNLQIIINQRNDEVKKLKEELFQIKTESERSIKALKSQLQFKEATLHGAQQETMHFKTIKDSNNETTNSAKFPKITIVAASPTRKKRPTTFDNNNFDIISQSPKKMRITSFNDLDKSFKKFEVSVETHLNDSSAIIPGINKISFTNEPLSSPEAKSEFPVGRVNMSIQPQENILINYQNICESFNYTLNISDEKDIWNLFTIAEIKSPQECCVSINYDKMFGFSVKAMHQIIPLLKQSIKSDDSDSTITDCMKKVLQLLSLQFQRLTISICKRKGSVDNIFDDILSRKPFNKFDLLINPQYSCLFHYIYPVSEVLQKMFLIVDYHLFYAEQFLLECLLPNLFKIISYLVIDFCCGNHIKDGLFYQCRTIMNGNENLFAKQMLRLIIQIISQTSSSTKDCIFNKISKSFKNLIPLFASKLDLKIIIIELFCEMLNYSNFLNFLSQHCNDSCLIYIIMDLLNCNCIKESSEEDLIKFSNSVTQIIYSLCLVGFKWSVSCACSNQIFLLMSNIGLNVIRHISENKWSETNKECIQNILILYNQMKMALGPDVYSEFANICNSHEFFTHLDYLADCQHPLLIEDTWPFEYSWFSQMMTDAKFFNKK